MPAFNAIEMLTWLHVIFMAAGGGAAVTALLLSGLEEARTEFAGLAAATWKKLVVWCFRFAVVFGAILLVTKLSGHANPFVYKAFHMKLGAASLLTLLAERTPVSLAKGKRGGATLVVVLFLLTTFFALNKSPFGFTRPSPAPAAGPAPMMQSAQ